MSTFYKSSLKSVSGIEHGTDGYDEFWVNFETGVVIQKSTQVNERENSRRWNNLVFHITGVWLWPGAPLGVATPLLGADGAYQTLKGADKVLARKIPADAAVLRKEEPKPLKDEGAAPAVNAV